MRYFAIVIFAFLSFSTFCRAQQPAESAKSEKQEEKFDAGEMIMHHIGDSHEWHFFNYGKLHATVPLPVILYNKDHGLSAFSYGKFEEGKRAYDNYYINPTDHKIHSLDGSDFYDFSITKNVTSMIISALLLLWVMTAAARRYKRGPMTAPNGFQNAIEVIVNFVRNEIVKPMLGNHTDKYLPYLLTIFFFIWINNLMGLLPGAANVTGNIAVTMTLALFTFVISLFSSRRVYWHHLLTAPGAPFVVKIILVPIEVISAIVTKPGALMIRLFANITAGHLIVLSFLTLIFIFAQMFGTGAGLGISVFSVAFAIFIYMLELLVAALQAYIFTALSTLFISEAIADHGHEHELISMEENDGSHMPNNALAHHHDLNH